MSKKKVTLTEAKEILKSEKVFYNGNNKFNIVDVGKYHSGVTIVVPQEWKIGYGKKVESPIEYEEIRELTAEMNIDFDGEEKVLLGNYRVSKNGKPVFELTKPTKAKDAMIKISWGGSFNSTYGLDREEAQKIEAKFYTKSASNGGRSGNDYLVLPVNFVKGREPRDVSELLKKVEENQNVNETKIDKENAKKDEILNKSIANREKILKMAEPIIEEIKKYSGSFQYKALEEHFECSGGYFYEMYNEELIEKLKKRRDFIKGEYQKRKKYEPKFMSMSKVLNNIDLSIKCGEVGATIVGQDISEYQDNFDYTQKDYERFLNRVQNFQNKYAKKQKGLSKLEGNIKQKENQKTKEALADDIIRLMKEKNDSEEKMKNVKELVQKYEEQVKNSEKEQDVGEI